MVIAKAQGEREMGKWYKKGIEFQFCKMIKLQRSVAQQCESYRH
jgi:hypothetical protein